MRSQVYKMLQEITPNVFQDYPEQDKDFPCLIYSLTYTGEPDHDGIGFFDCSLRVEIYAKTSEERSQLEYQLIVELIKKGWANTSNVELPHPDYYRNSLMFSTIK